jgi:hypothetical protein
MTHADNASAPATNERIITLQQKSNSRAALVEL